MILVSGGTGVMGARLVRGLVKAGWKIRVLTLPDDPYVSRLEGLNCEVVYGDVSDASSLKGAFDGVEIVYHLAAIIIAYDPSLFQKINVQGTKNMLEGASAAGVKHFIYVSSASVTYPKPTPYSLSKQECERMIQEQKSMHYTIVRPTLVYEKDGAQEFMMFYDYLLKFPIVPFIGRGRALKNPVHTDDTLKGLAAIPGNEKTYSKIYNFSGGEAITIWDLAKLMLKHQGKKKLFVPIPVPVCILLSKIMKLIMKKPPLTWNIIAGITQDANLDNSLTNKNLGYQPIGISDGLQKCYPI
jgi:nucleoside-diphosphate-sugar epimerase